MRYFLELAYNGTRFCGYQEQPNGITIQSEVERALGILLRVPTKIVGCGRTDSGVHALQYFAHFDATQDLTKDFAYHLNSLLGKDIVCSQLIEVAEDAHARYDATSRSYQYVIDLTQNPFRQETAYFCRYGNQLDVDKMQAAAKLLLNYKDFTTFCKSRTDNKTNLCDLKQSEWVFNEKEQQLVYQVTSNRFLRGMIRLIVGMCLNVGKGNISIELVKAAMEEQKTLKSALSASAEGLFLMDIKYDFIG
ncbi:MAG: tRNA pseudouridine(38-40) synthase TruA [Aureispira sp.]|nr:tRNA pseudouridine(38-40) synthase TruA [Aureispira sp.]